MDDNSLLGLGYEPVNIGKIHMKLSTVVYGLAYDHNRMLIALSIQGPNTQIEQVHYELQGADRSLSVIVNRSTDEFDRAVYSKSSHFKVFKSPIPDTNEVSMIMLNDQIFEMREEQTTTFLKAPSLEVFKNELYHRVKSIVYCTVEPEWTDYLYTAGLSKRDPTSRQMMCGVLPNRKETHSWMSAGFNIGYCVCDREMWTDLISSGIKNGLIQFPSGGGSTSGKE